MSNYIISTSSTADLTEQFILENNVKCLHYILNMDGKDYADDCGHSISYKALYDSMRNGAMPTTSMVNPAAYEEYFSALLEEGKDILHIEFSSSASGSCNNAVNVAEELNKRNDNKIFIVDSMCYCRGLGLLVYHAVQNKKGGMDIAENLNWLEVHKLNINCWFTVTDLGYLQRSGRMSKVTAAVGSMLNIKPILNVSPEGKLVHCYNVRGRKKSIQTIVEHMKKDIVNHEGQMVYICHGDCIEDAEYLSSLIAREFPNVLGIEIGYIGMVIASHSGPGTLAVFFMGNERYSVK